MAVLAKEINDHSEAADHLLGRVRAKEDVRNLLKVMNDRNLTVAEAAKIVVEKLDFADYMAPHENYKEQFFAVFSEAFVRSLRKSNPPTTSNE